MATAHTGPEIDTATVLQAKKTCLIIVFVAIYTWEFGMPAEPPGQLMAMQAVMTNAIHLPIGLSVTHSFEESS